MNRFAFFYFLVALLLTPAAPAIEDFTEPVGAYSFPAKAGRNAFTPGLVGEKKFFGELTGIVPNPGADDYVFQVAGANWPMNEFSAHPDGTPTHYVEIIPPAEDPSHPAVGLALDIVFSSPSAFSVDIDAAGLAAFELVDGAGDPTSGMKVCVRPHATVKRIFESTIDAITPFTDKVIVLHENGAASRYVYNNFSGKWVDEVFAPADHRIVYPGQGIIFVVVGGIDKDLFIGGAGLSHIKTTPTRVSLYAGVTNLIGQVNPLSASAGTLSDLDFVSAFSGSSDMADKVTVFQNPLGPAVAQYGKLFGNMVNTITFQNAADIPIRYSEAIKVFPVADTHIVLPPGF